MRKKNNPFQDHSPMNKILIVLLGPTGVGKTDIAIDLAIRYGCEIISADSRQIYREMCIGTAVPDYNQLNIVKHHFVRSISVEEYYSSSIFERDVLNLLPSLFSINNVVMMSGGSGMYIDAVCDGTDDIPDVDPAAREKYITLYKDEGINGLRIALRLLDPEHYSKVDLKNYKRLIRALEICETTGRPYSSFLSKQKRKRDFSTVKIGLRRTRDDLYQRINARVNEMVRLGLEDEVRQLVRYRHLNALNCVGYKEFFNFFDGTISKDKAIELIKRNSRRYAKRQMTWWAKDKNIRWFQADQIGDIIQFIEDEIKGRSLSENQG
jgi:tRNA dimethylallyltransferase